ncbi:MAG: crotonase/enoyl-CoA hydratase family protein [Pseudomonadales bacterium]|nr:crotonase/enoyl-CoA hydratase family protein [Pseudomonadales bacterium]
MNYQCFDVTIKDRIAHIVMNRPEKRNSMIPAYWDELPKVISDIEDQPGVRVIVISSTGPHFTSGMDVSAFGNSTKGDEGEDQVKHNRLKGARFIGSVKHLQQAFTCLEQCRVPVLAAIQGGAIGAGVDLVTACDLRYVTEDAFFTIFEINIGMTADVGTFPRITALLPEGIVKEMAYTGRRLSAAEARSFGFVNQVFKNQEELLAGVMEVAKEIARKAPLAIHGSKRIINYSRDHSTEDALDYIIVWNASMLQSDEIQEAMMANAEKREADFVDLPTPKKKMSDTIND